MTKITPKKTKITTDKSEYETKNTNFYNPTDESVWRENTLALYFKESKKIIESLNKAKTDQIPDEKLFEFTIKQAEQFVNNKTVEKLTEQFEGTLATNANKSE